ncbi:maltose ABC transporter permease MalF, partial [Xanthomonas citri pv. citri]|nr:maltose ABC transporter permease MalF [Xanthomonas citri pv. citri]
DEQNQILTNNESGERYKPNDDIGFFQPIDEQGNFTGNRLEPGYTVSVGWQNFVKILTDDGVQEPFIKIFIWTVVFALLTVIFTT